MEQALEPAIRAIVRPTQCIRICCRRTVKGTRAIARQQSMLVTVGRAIARAARAPASYSPNFNIKYFDCYCKYCEMI